MEQRLQKFLAACGVASRRECEKIIESGRVCVNNKKANLGDKTDPDYDVVTLDGNVIKFEKKVYIMLHKPNGCVTTSKEQFGRPTVLDIVKRDIPERLFCVGRLDYNTEGLILLTNDGDFANKITHPKSKIPKTYLVQVKGGAVTLQQLRNLRAGVELEDGKTLPCRANIEEIYPNGTTLIKIKITEGRNRQVRRMVDAIGHPAIYLKRIQVGDIILGNLPYGKWRHLSEAEIKSFK